MPADHASDQPKTETPDPTSAMPYDLLRRRVSRSLQFLAGCTVPNTNVPTLNLFPTCQRPILPLLRRFERFSSSSAEPSLFNFFYCNQDPSPGRATIISPFLILYKPPPSLDLMGPLQVTASGVVEWAILSTLALDTYMFRNIPAQATNLYAHKRGEQQDKIKESLFIILARLHFYIKVPF